MAAQNKTLGRFILDGIPPAPRGVPQIEVTFDIDANGIVSVTAKDLGTGKEQKITITASTNMSKEDIDRAVREAEQYAEEDRLLREAADTKNRADSLVFQVEKTLSDLGDKLEESEKGKVREALEKLKETLNRNGSTEELKAGIEELEKEFFAVSEKLYSKSGAATEQEPGADGDGTYYNADFEDKTK
jgi:molecular chaperone DnaK